MMLWIRTADPLVDNSNKTPITPRHVVAGAFAFFAVFREERFVQLGVAATGFCTTVDVH